MLKVKEQNDRWTQLLSIQKGRRVGQGCGWWDDELSGPEPSDHSSSSFRVLFLPEQSIRENPQTPVLMVSP